MKHIQSLFFLFFFFNKALNEKYSTYFLMKKFYDEKTYIK